MHRKLNEGKLVAVKTDKNYALKMFFFAILIITLCDEMRVKSKELTNI